MDRVWGLLGTTQDTVGRFALVSMLGTVIDLGLLWILVSHLHVPIIPATVVSTEASIVNSFIWNEAWTFRGHAQVTAIPQRFLAFNLTYAGTLVISAVITGGLVVIFGSGNYIVYKALTLPLNFVWNLVWSTRVIWRAARGQAPSDAI